VRRRARPQKAMARKSVPSVDSRSHHPQMTPIAGPFPPQLCFPQRRLVAAQAVVQRWAGASPTKSNGPEIGAICGQQISSSTDDTDCQPIPAATLFPPDGGSSLRRASCGDGPGPRPQKGMARKSVPSVDSRSHHPQIAGPFPPQLCFPQRRLVAAQTVVRRRARASPTRRNGPAIGAICGQQIRSSTDCRPIPAAALFSPTEARRRPDRRAATGQGHAHKKE
jgi:hypothetical protein